MGEPYQHSFPVTIAPQQPDRHEGADAQPNKFPHPTTDSFDPSTPPLTGHGPPKPHSSGARKRPPPGTEHIKHRRTRSGCYTCRSRRVKCDEARPTCERCRKGKRECTWPERPASSKPAGTRPGRSGTHSTSKNRSASPVSSNDELEDVVEGDAEGTAGADWEETGLSPHPVSHQPTAKAYSTTSDTPSLTGTGSPSVSPAQVPKPAFCVAEFLSPIPAANTANWAVLAPEQQFYLTYFYQNISHYDYAMYHDSESLFTKLLPSAAIRSGNEALLCAVVGFSALRFSVNNPGTSIDSFLWYYNNSVTLLLASLASREPPTIVTLLTILQLTTIEDCLGDWETLTGHLRAACEVLQTLFTPEAATRTTAIQGLVDWYRRYDLINALRQSSSMLLPRPWFVNMLEAGKQNVIADPNNMGLRINTEHSALRIITYDLAKLYALQRQNEIPNEEFVARHNALEKKLYDWKANLDPFIIDPSCLVTDFPHQVPLGPEDIVDPYKPGRLYNYPLFPVTILMADWYSAVVYHKAKKVMLANTPSPPDIPSLALAVCEIFETIERHPSVPTKALRSLQTGFATSTLFLPRDRRHDLWIRRKFALLESMGMMIDRVMRDRISKLYEDGSSWLPLNECPSPAIRDIRALLDERRAGLISPPQNDQVRDISEVLDKLNIK